MTVTGKIRKVEMREGRPPSGSASGDGGGRGRSGGECAGSMAG